MADLNELIDKTHFDYEKNEETARQLEERILKVPGMSKQYLPKRQYGQSYKGKDFGLTVQSLIVRGDKPLAAFLGLDLDYWRKKNKEMEEREAYLNAFKEKTEKLKELNQQENLVREKRTLWNQTHGVDQRRY